jgi:hypothetical protein
MCNRLRPLFIIKYLQCPQISTNIIIDYCACLVASSLSHCFHESLPLSRWWDFYLWLWKGNILADAILLVFSQAGGRLFLFCWLSCYFFNCSALSIFLCFSNVVCSYVVSLTCPDWFVTNAIMGEMYSMYGFWKHVNKKVVPAILKIYQWYFTFFVS